MKQFFILWLLIVFNPTFKLWSQNTNFGWAKQIGGANNNQSFSVAVDKNGNVYTTGIFQGQVDFDPGPGTFYLNSDGGSIDIFISKIDALGNFIWAKRIGGSSFDYSYSIAISVSGDIYSTGYFVGSSDFDPGLSNFILTASGTANLFISKLDPDGNFIWAKQIGGKTTYDPIYGFSIALDAQENVYTTGQFNGTVDFDPGNSLFELTSSGISGIFVSKLNSDGNFIWANQMSGGDGDNYGISIAVDVNGNVYTLGNFNGKIDFDPGPGVYNLTAALREIFICKFNSNGNLIYAQHRGSAGGDNFGNSLVLDNQGNVYFAGKYSGIVDFDPGISTYNLISNFGTFDAFISKLDPQGNLVWAYGLGGDFDQGANAITLDKDGNLYVAGFFNFSTDFDPGPATFILTPVNSLSASDIFISKFDPSGKFLWAGQIGGSQNKNVSSISSNSNGDIYITGNFTGTTDFDPSFGIYNQISTGNNDIFLLKLGVGTSSELVISNHIDKNDAFNIDHILWSGNLNTMPISLKVCADGSDATKIHFTNNSLVNSNNIGFRIKSDPNASNPEELGSFSITLNNGNEIEAAYHHPRYLNLIYKPNRQDILEIYNITNTNQVLFSLPLEIYRAPIVFVHGLWGNAKSFSILEDYLWNDGYYVDELTTRVNYQVSSLFGFEYNKLVVPDGINDAFYQCRQNNFSAGKVNLICHSMGGILSRLYLQENYGSIFRNDINALITINTPHSGSQLANFALGDLAGIVCYALGFINNQYWKDCPISLADLSVNSFAIDNDLNGNLKNANVTPSATISTEENFLSLSVICDGLFTLFSTNSFYNPSKYLSKIFNNETNDLVVARSSQDAGFIGNQNFHAFNQCHLGATENTSVIAWCEALLSKDPKSSYFSQSGFNPPDLKYPLLPSGGGVSFLSGDVNIISPVNGSTYSPGDVVNISVSGTSNVAKLTLVAGNSTLPIYGDNTLSNSTVFSYSIPAEASGEIRFLVIGIDKDTSFVDLDSLKININVQAKLDSLTIYPKLIFVPKGGQNYFQLIGHYTDGVSRDITYEKGVQLLIDNSTIAKNISTNIIEGLIIDSTEMSINYQFKNLKVPIVVYPGSGIITNTKSENVNSKYSEKLQLYPNPNNGIFNIQLDNNLGESIEIKIYNELGQQCYKKIEKLNSLKYNNIISIENVTSGIYFLTVNTRRKHYVNKFIVKK